MGYHLIDEIVKVTLLIQQELHKIQNILSGLKLHIFRLKLMNGKDYKSFNITSSCSPRIFRKGI